MNPGVPPDPGGADGARSVEPPAEAPLGDAPTRIVDVPADVRTDPPVDTEAVEVPPVTVATVDRPDGPRRVGSKVAAAVGVIGLLAIGGVLVYGYSLNQDLGTTRGTLATTETDLGSTQGTLEDTEERLATTTAQLEAKTTEKDALVEEVRGLAAQVATQTECVAKQEAALAELIRLSGLQTDNFNRTAEGSAWDTAERKRGDNIDAALDAFYAAYSQAFQGNTGAAKTQADRGNNAQSNIAEAEAQLVAEVNLVNTTATEISMLLDDLERQLTEIEATCGATAP